MSRRRYPKHKDDAFDRFITDWSHDERTGKFSFAKMVALFEALGVPEFIPCDGTNGTKRMTAGIALRSWFVDGVLRFKDGTTVTLAPDEEWP